MLKKLNLTLVIVSVLLISSCNKVKTKSVEKDITSGTWKITQFSEDSDDQTAHFNSYTFTFNDGGTVTATNSNNTISGTWSVTKDKSNDDSSSNVDFILSFPATDDFDELNDDWDILTQSSSKLELKDVSGGNGGTDLLTFEKK
jgi:major membrane immunogen (membrane-anchored lipoprotein)|tara:strand:- start:3718 stop:4149 length:432 start_codon:yes stop_codon:yes gene_type:complete